MLQHLYREINLNIITDVRSVLKFGINKITVVTLCLVHLFCFSTFMSDRFCSLVYLLCGVMMKWILEINE